jgi:hypothetical protein
MEMEMKKRSLGLEGPFAREHAMAQALRRMNLRQVAELQGPPRERSWFQPGMDTVTVPLSDKLRQFLEDEIDGKHLPPAPDPKDEALRQEIGTVFREWQAAAEHAVAIRSAGFDRTFPDEVAGLLSKRRAAMANGNVARAEAIEDELVDLGLPPMPAPISAKAVVERRERGLDF